MNSILFEGEIVPNIRNIFTVTFDQFNEFLLNKMTTFFKKNLTDH